MLVFSEACGADQVCINAVQWNVYYIYAAIIGMLFKAKNELEEYLTSINPIYAKYTEDLWAYEVNSVSQLGDASLTALQACGIQNLVHAGNIIAQSKASGKWSCSCCSITLVHCPASIRSCAAASCLRAFYTLTPVWEITVCT